MHGQYEASGGSDQAVRMIRSSGVASHDANFRPQFDFCCVAPD